MPVALGGDRVTAAIDPFAAATEMLGALRARRVSAVELLDLHISRIERPYLEDRTPLRFAALVAQAWGGFTRPPGYDD
jgi:hypothetical protein